MSGGLVGRVHAEQVEHTGAAKRAAELGCASADHLERIDAEGINAMAAHGTIGVLLPGAMTYLGDAPPPVAELLEAGVDLAVATDFNPGSSPVRDLWACATLACIRMGLSVEQALVGITRNAGRALGRSDLTARLPRGLRLPRGAPDVQAGRRRAARAAREEARGLTQRARGERCCLPRQGEGRT